MFFRIEGIMKEEKVSIKGISVITLVLLLIYISAIMAF